MFKDIKIKQHPLSEILYSPHHPFAENTLMNFWRRTAFLSLNPFPFAFFFLLQAFLPLNKLIWRLLHVARISSTLLSENMPIAYGP